ncbi:MAG: transglutaminase domain-containing protein [Chloroflexi bacterium]|nr:transglutaminase domain-containing protein [Chloroflexota bacterium]
MNEMEKWLKSTPTFDFGNKSIEEKAKDITKGYEEASDKARSLFYFVRDKIKFIPHLPVGVLESYQASKILKARGGMCIQKAILLATLARAVGIPALVHFVDIRNHRVPTKIKEVLGTNLFPYHGYNELYIDGKWVKAAPTFELKVCQENRLIPVEFDGKHDALLPSHDLDGNPHIEYLQDHGRYENIPLDKIYDAWTQAYGLEARRGLNQFIEV